MSPGDNAEPVGDLTVHQPPSVGLSCQHTVLEANCFLLLSQGLTKLASGSAQFPQRIPPEGRLTRQKQVFQDSVDGKPHHPYHPLAKEK